MENGMFHVWFVTQCASRLNVHGFITRKMFQIHTGNVSKTQMVRFSHISLVFKHEFYMVQRVFTRD